MRAAPPVAVSLHEPRREQQVSAVLGGLAAAALAAWAMGHALDLAPLWVHAAVVLVAGLAGVIAGRTAWPASQATGLRWDGQAWRLAGPGGAEHPTRVRLMIDVGAWLLLRCHCAGRVHWLGLWRERCAAAWSPLRAALYCPVPEASAAAPLPPPDSPA